MEGRLGQDLVDWAAVSRSTGSARPQGSATGGAVGVGRAATRAVVASCVLILISDYVLATLLFGVLFK